ncbi:MAG: PilZ domain-containing protein [Deltaproteobacteria bacterium]|nr:PilZ domain-containing protein [Deltaproteobacteria bacterium]MBN2672658.1 PilZ domain-containing protein [Deltaproteobacteria bacterium]
MKKRFELRRSINYPMEVITSHWDEPVLLATSDLSPRGAYINCDCLPEIGEYVVCSFSTDGNTQYDFFGQVVRTNLMRRTEDRGEAGFGVEFLDSKPMERIQIREHLRGTPPPVPIMRKVSKEQKVIKRK